MAQRTKYTPEPWKIGVDGTNTGRGPVIKTDGPYYDDGTEREIAVLETTETRQSLAVNPKARWKRTRDADEIEANAHLIAAAPDLLEACRKAVACASVPDHTRELLIAAIAKSEGK